MAINYIAEPTSETFTIPLRRGMRERQASEFENVEQPISISLREHVAFIRNQLVIIMGAIKEIKGQAVEHFGSPKLREKIGEVISCVGQAISSTDLVRNLYTKY